MAIRIEESFDVQASPDRVWAYLIDPRQVVQCLPGAELLEVEDARNFTGRIRVKVGPVTASYRGRARFEELDETARRVRMTGQGQETGGGGTARMAMTSEVVALPDGGSRVRVESEVDVLGKLVQFGRGMIEEVSHQLFSQFAECARARLETAVPEADAAAAGGTPTTTGVAAGPQTNAPADPTEVAPVSALPLLWAAFRRWIRRFF